MISAEISSAKNGVNVINMFFYVKIDHCIKKIGKVKVAFARDFENLSAHTDCLLCDTVYILYEND